MFGIFKRDSSPVPIKTVARSSVSYLGKLPAAADFLKFQVTRRESVAFDLWLQDAYALYSRQMAEHAQPQNGMHRMGFALTGAEDEGCVIGMFSPSQDKSGRQYPFAILAILSETSLKKHGVNLLHGSWQVQKDILELWQASWLPNNVQLLNQHVLDIESRLKGLEANIEPMKCLNRLREISLGQIFDQMNIPLQGRTAFIEACSTVLRGIGHRGTRRTHFGIRVPLGDNVDLNLMTFWMFLISTMVKEPSWRPQLYWTYPDNEIKASLTVFFKPITPSYFSHLISEHPFQDYIVDLAKVARNMHNISDFSREVASLTHLNVLDAARRWSKE